MNMCKYCNELRWVRFVGEAGIENILEMYIKNYGIVEVFTDDNTIEYLYPSFEMNNKRLGFKKGVMYVCLFMDIVNRIEISKDLSLNNEEKVEKIKKYYYKIIGEIKYIDNDKGYIIVMSNNLWIYVNTDFFDSKKPEEVIGHYIFVEGRLDGKLCVINDRR